MLTLRTLNLNNPRAAFRNFLLAAAALIALTAASLIPTPADAGRYHFGDADELLDDLIEMDARDIDELQADLVEARADIKEAIGDIEEAKEDVKDAPGGEAIAKVAFNIARAAVDRATGKAINKARETLNEAETILGDRRDELGEAEFHETLGAIEMIRSELIEIEYALDDLTAALREA